MRKNHRWYAWALVAALTAGACAAREASEQTLKDSFAEQIASVASVRDFRRDGDELTFTAPNREKADARWRVHIDSAVLDPPGGQPGPVKGAIESSWFVDGQALLSSGSFSGLPEEFLEKGVGQECWAFWDADAGRWSWV